MWPSLNVIFWTDHVRIRGLFLCTPDSVRAMEVASAFGTSASHMGTRADTSGLEQLAHDSFPGPSYSFLYVNAAFHLNRGFRLFDLS